MGTGRQYTAPPHPDHNNVRRVRSRRHPRVHLHFTPTYASGLNQVELWFAKIERDLLPRGIFTSIPDLARKIRRYIALYNNTNAEKADCLV